MKNTDSQNGQSIFEFIVMLPFFMFFFSVFVSVGSSINGSINQQKLVRAYAYNRIKHNSTHPESRLLNTEFLGNGVKTAGIVMIGYVSKMVGGKSPYAPCFKAGAMLGEEPRSETCDEKVKEDYSTFIKVKTIYGVCGETYTSQGQTGYVQLRSGNVTHDWCTLKSN